MTLDITIRQATPEDAAAVREIYLPYVVETAVTFEIKPPSVEEMKKRIINKSEQYPYLVAVGSDGELYGFTYASTFRPRTAYMHSVETSIYVRRDYKGHGLGRRLYTALDKILLLQNVCNLYACVAYMEPEDEYVPAASKHFHEKLGFHEAACFTKCGFKFNRWYDLLCMEKFIGNRPENPKDFIPLPAIAQEDIQNILSEA